MDRRCQTSRVSFSSLTLFDKKRTPRNSEEMDEAIRDKQNIFDVFFGCQSMNDLGAGGNGTGDGTDGALGLGFLLVVSLTNTSGPTIKRGHEI